MELIRIKYGDTTYEFNYPTLFDYYLFIDGQKVRVFDRLALRDYNITSIKKARIITILFRHFPAFATEDEVFSNIPDAGGLIYLMQVFGYKPHELLQLNPYELDFAVRLAEYINNPKPDNDSSPQE